MNELSLIATLKRLCPSNDSVILGIDDDAAVLRPSTREALVCTDMLMEGVHFLAEKAGARAVGRKALAVNLSDIAAMGGKALSAFVALALPQDLAQASFIEDLYRGMTELALEFDVAIAGGDTNIWTGPLVITVTVVGEAHAKGPVLRSGAKVGDTIFVSGPLGGSILGHHLSFTPRLTLARDLMNNFSVTSMLDISDGLAKDLREIIKQSRVSAYLNAESIPLNESIRHQPDTLKAALCDGEDFELCFTLSPSEAARLLTNPHFANCRPIGTIQAGEGLYWDHDKSPIAWSGFEHRAPKG
ncbi:MAG: thiamine-monophosphate kinase [Chitinophagaceae bacterium]|nr:thiamine-monophosphate kinase [Oligoflexus sp.]